jgi:uncharacterized protein
VVRRVLQAGFGLDSAPEVSESLPSLAAAIGDMELLRLLLDTPAPMHGMTSALLNATESGPVEALELLLAYGADPNGIASSEFRTPLMNAAVRGDTAMVRLLLAHGAVVSACDRQGRTAAELARRHRRRTVLPLLQPRAVRRRPAG